MHESDESKITRFVSGLRREIQDIVELYEYNSFKNTHNDGFYKSSWKDKNKFQNKTFPSNFSKEPTSQNRILKTPLLILLLNHPPKPQVENVLNV